MRFRLAAVALALSASTAGAQWSTRYFQSFNTAWLTPDVFTATSGTISTSGGIDQYGVRAGCTSGTYCTKSLGQSPTTGFSNHEVQLSIFGLGAHAKARVSFTLLLWDSWDGNKEPGPDLFRFRSDGITMLDATFSNFFGVDQSYPNDYGAGTAPAFTGAVEVGTLGTSPWFPGSSVYELSYEFVHTGDDIANKWDARGLQGWGDEGWTLDNIRIETFRGVTEVVPEPSTYALMATGLVGVFGLARRRRS